MFFVGSAPNTSDGHVNISPKGLDSFRIIDERRVMYVDLTGSAAETIAHIKENGRIVFMFCAFEGPANIVRLHGEAKVHQMGSEVFEECIGEFPNFLSARAIIQANIHRVSDSCGYAVPFYDYRGQRETLLKWADRQGAEALKEYRVKKNQHSIDGLTAFESNSKRNSEKNIEAELEAI